jgi:16S rRNA (cytidine1402-2'-O)-methyltransferase
LLAVLLLLHPRIKRRMLSFMKEGTLYIVATPIGNLEDITLRALRILKEVDVIYAEDTRVTKKLLSKYEIDIPIKRLDAHTEEKSSAEIIVRLQNGETVAYVSDAGTPTISDPGYRLVRTVRESGYKIEAVPGPAAVTAALSISGVPADEFTFLGFLPHKKGRQTALKEIADSKRTTILFESKHRILKLIEEFDEYVPDRKVYVARELTKMHEEVLFGSAREIKEILENDPQKQKGEFVVIIEPLN